MKTKIFKALSVVLALMVVLSTCILVASAASATITFDDTAKRTIGTTSQQVWVENGITVTNDKGSSTSNVNTKYYNPVRFYKSSDVTIEYPGMTQIVIACNSSDYATACKNSITSGTVTSSGKNVTIVLAEAIDSYKFVCSGGQIRVDSITVYTGDTAPEEPEVPENNDPAADSTLTIVEAIALGTSKEHNVYTDGKYYVTGEITEVYNAQYGNMYIKDAEGNQLTIYGTYSADGKTGYSSMETKPVAGDTVKIYGIIGQYNGTAQIKNGWIVEHTPSETPVEPEEPEVQDPAADSTLTIAEAIALGASKAHNVYTEGKYYVAGEITEVYNEQYGNMKIKDAEGNILTIYGTYSADGTVSYKDLEVKPVAGDTVKIYGVIGNYNGTAQIKDGWIVEHTPAAPEEPTICTHAYDDDFDVFCNNCNEMREINYPADKVELKEIDGVKYIYVNGITSVEGLFKVGNDYYCATWGGVVLTGDQYVHFSYCDKAAGRHFYFSEDGKMLDKGFVTGEDGIKRLYVDSRTSVEGLFEVDGKYYLATWGGVVLTDGRYYVTESFAEGIKAGKNFTVNAEGEILDGIVEIDGQKYYYDFGTTVIPGEYEVGGQTVVATWGGLIVE